MTRNSPPKLGGEPARTKSEQAGWFPCRYWQLREPPRPRLRSGSPPNLGGECPHSNSFTAPMSAGLSAVVDRRYSVLRNHFLFAFSAAPFCFSAFSLAAFSSAIAFSLFYLVGAEALAASVNCLAASRSFVIGPCCSV